MAYIVLARKKRPVSFDSVIGQRHITETLKKAIEKNRVAHAYIFSGTRGVGKTSTARILARAMNCEQGPTPEPCGVCGSCRDIASGVSINVQEIDGASNNSVNDIRELRSNIRYSSMDGGYRIYVIDEVHMLTREAFNALLKTLEEPPEKVIFIFATTEPSKIPDTIVSRTQRYDFRRVSDELIFSHLVEVCDQEEMEYDSSAVKVVAAKADGSVRDSLSLLDQIRSFCGDERITEEAVRSVLGLISKDTFSRLMKSFDDSAPGEAVSLLREVLKTGYDLDDFIGGFQEYLRGILTESVTASEGAEGSGFSVVDILRMSEMVREAEYRLKHTNFPVFLVETLLIRLAYMDEAVTISSLIQDIESDSGATAVKKDTGDAGAKKKVKRG